MSKDQFDDGFSRLELVKQAITSFRGLLEENVDRRKVGTASDIPYKLIVARQALIWRTSELAEGAIVAIEAENWLSAAVLSRLLMETVALHVELYRIAQRAGVVINPSDLDRKVQSLLNGGTTGARSLARMAELGMIDHVDKAVEGFRSTYDDLGEFVTLQANGTLGLFGLQNPDGLSVSFSRYPGHADSIEDKSLNALKLSLFASVHFLKLQMENMERFKAVCDAFAKTSCEEQKKGAFL